MKKVLTIAGSDCSGGAGIQADLKTIAANGCYGMSVITALTAQNTCGVSGIQAVDAKFIGAQLDAVFTDIFPDAIKIGMIPSAEAVSVIAQKLTQYQAKNIVLDPVMVATSGSTLSTEPAICAMKEQLFPIVSLITPNTTEAARLTESDIIDNRERMENAAKCLKTMTNGGILIKGGHLSDDAMDLLLWNDRFYRYTAKRIDNPNTHGTGCTLSSAIACGLAKRLSLDESVGKAKDYLTGAIADQMNLGKGHGPLNHIYAFST